METWDSMFSLVSYFCTLYEELVLSYITSKYNYYSYPIYDKDIVKEIIDKYSPWIFSTIIQH